MSINSVTLVGNLTRDPELRGLPSGGSVASMRVAVNERRRTQSGEWEDAPNFFNVSVFGNSADAVAKHLAKGSQVAIDGRLRWREWEDQQGNRRESVEVVARDVQFIGAKSRPGPPPMSDADRPGGYPAPGSQTGGSAGPSAPAASPGPSGPGPAPNPRPAPAPADDDIPF